MFSRLKIYAAHAMTGRYCDELWKEAAEIKALCDQCGVEVYDPVTKENIPNIHALLPDRGDAEGLPVWQEDKRAFRDECHVLIDFNAHRKSFGVSQEVGLNRFGYWKPTIRVFPANMVPAMIVRFESDVIVSSPEEAVRIASERWGTWGKRFKWRLSMYRRSRLKALWYEFKFWFQ